MKNSPSVLTLLSQYYKYIYREMQIQVPNQVPLKYLFFLLAAK